MRFAYAVSQRDTTQQRDLIAALVEEASIIDHKLTGKEATKMRGRSNITSKKCERNLLEGAEKEARDEDIDRLAKLRKSAGEHTSQGSKLLNLARMMKLTPRTNRSR